MSRIRNYFSRTGFGSSQAAAVQPAMVLDVSRNATPLTLTNNVNTEILFNVETLDENNWYNPANGRFNPKVAGWYDVYGAVFTEYAAAISAPSCNVRKNGLSTGNNAFTGLYLNAVMAGGVGIPLLGRFYLDGVNDYISGFFYHNSGANRQTNTTDPSNTYLRIYKIS